MTRWYCPGCDGEFLSEVGNFCPYCRRRNPFRVTEQDYEVPEEDTEGSN